MASMSVQYICLLQCMTNSCSKTLYVDRVNNVADFESCDCHVIIILLLQMLEKGPCDYHRPVMRLIHAYLKLQDCQAPEIVTISREILAVVCQHIKVSSELFFFLPPSYVRDFYKWQSVLIQVYLCRSLVDSMYLHTSTYSVCCYVCMCTYYLLHV